MRAAVSACRASGVSAGPERAIVGALKDNRFGEPTRPRIDWPTARHWRSTPGQRPRRWAGCGLQPVDRREVEIERGAANRPVSQQKYQAMIAPPMRVWCDLGGEPRGTEFAAHLWEMTRHGR